MPIKKLKNLLNSGASGSLKQVIQTAKDMDFLTSALHDAMNPEMAENLLAANIREGDVLVVICSSSAWASRIRFESIALLAAAGSAGFDAKSVRVMVTRS